MTKINWTARQLDKYFVLNNMPNNIRHKVLMVSMTSDGTTFKQISIQQLMRIWQAKINTTSMLPHKPDVHKVISKSNSLLTILCKKKIGNELAITSRTYWQNRSIIAKTLVCIWHYGKQPIELTIKVRGCIQWAGFILHLDTVLNILDDYMHAIWDCMAVKHIWKQMTKNCFFP